MICYSLCERSAKPGTKKEEIESTKTYGVAQLNDVVDLSEFSRHIAEHGSVYRRSDIQAVLLQMVDCLHEMILDGKKVQLGELGAFSPSLTTEGTEKAEDFTANNIKKVRTLWSPGKMFKDVRQDAEFQMVPSRAAQAEALAKERGKETDPTTPSGTDNGGNTGTNTGDQGGTTPGGNDNPDGIE